MTSSSDVRKQTVKTVIRRILRICEKIADTAQTQNACQDITEFSTQLWLIYICFHRTSASIVIMAKPNGKSNV